MKMLGRTWCLTFGLALVAGCPPAETGDDGDQGRTSSGEGRDNVDSDASDRTENLRRVGLLRANRMAFPPPAFDPVIFFVSGEFSLPNPDAATDPNTAVEQIGECVISPRGAGDPVLNVLDPGDVGLASVGETTVELRIRDTRPPPVYRPDYSAIQLIDVGFDAGVTVVFDFSGGKDIASFSGSVVVPSGFVLLAPDLTEGSFAFDNGSAVDIVWEAPETISDTDGNTKTTVQINFFDSLGDAPPSARVHVTCNVEDTGSYTVPADILARLPVREPDSFNFVVLRVHTTQVEVELTEGRTGIVQILGSVAVTGTATRRR